MTETWRGVCLDDGTGRNVYYVDENGQRSRKVPDNYVPEVFENGDRRYYFRGICIRCRKETPSLFITKGPEFEAFCLNYCYSCTLITSGEINNIKGNHDKIWGYNFDTPKHYFATFEKVTTDKKRDTKLFERAKIAHFHVKTLSKLRRNAHRAMKVKKRAGEFSITEGQHISWGFGEIYDEYFGAVDEQGLPSGLGVKFYSDESIYYGGWLKGLRHTSSTHGKGIFIRPDSSQYEGTWVLDLKHGRGLRRYPDGSEYKGEFAKGYEHGQGTRYYNDGFKFVGRFRFGKRDGPGTLTSPEGDVEKRIFKDTEAYHEKDVPEIVEIPLDKEKKYFEPDSLLSICIRALGKTMHTHKHLVPTKLLHHLLPSCMKPWIAAEYLKTMHPVGSKEFIKAVPQLAFRSLETVSLKAVKFANFDLESLIYFISANKMLTTLQLMLNRLDAASVEMLCKRFIARTWPNLTNLDLSFNQIDYTGIQNLVNGLLKNPNIQTLKLSGCNITANGALVIANYLPITQELTHLDLSFNKIQVPGCEAIAEALKKNRSLIVLNLRQNGIGSIGGELLADALQFNPVLKELCVADNKIGVDAAALISGRLRGRTRDVVHCMRSAELTIPAIHAVKQHKSFL